MSIEEFQSLGHGVVFQCGELSKYGSPMTLEMAEKLVNNKDLYTFFGTKLMT